MQTESIQTGTKNNRTGTNGTNENRGYPSVFEGRGEGSHKIPVQNWAINLPKKIIPIQNPQITLPKNISQKIFSKKCPKNVSKSRILDKIVSQNTEKTLLNCIYLGKVAYICGMRKITKMFLHYVWCKREWDRRLLSNPVCIDFVKIIGIW